MEIEYKNINIKTDIIFIIGNSASGKSTISEKYKKRRRQLRAKRMKIKDKTKETYVSGGFGLTSVPEYSQEDGTNQGNSKGKGQSNGKKEQDIALECNRQSKEK